MSKTKYDASQMQIVFFSQTLIISTCVCDFQAGKEPTYTLT
jgi:hypothetical protein